jgi:Ca2+-binding RTX toxin-like protein
MTTISSSVTTTLPIGVDTLILTGTDDINGTGNASNNTITGNAGNNILNGGGGADTMAGWQRHLRGR